MENIGFIIKSNIDDIIDSIQYELDFKELLVFDKLQSIGNEILESSKAIVPVDTNALKSSAFIESDESEKEIYVGYAKPDGPINPKSSLHVREYAEKVHEDVSMPHVNGQHHFLEYPARNRLISAEKELLDVID